MIGRPTPTFVQELPASALSTGTATGEDADLARVDDAFRALVFEDGEDGEPREYRPLRQFVGAMDAFERHDDRKRVGSVSSDEIGRVIHSYNTMLERECRTSCANL